MPELVPELVPELMIAAEGLSKRFILHNQDGLEIPVFRKASLTVYAGECVVLNGSSGSGKSTLLRTLYANYLAQKGSIHVRHGAEWVDMVKAAPHQVMDVRRSTMGYVSQFLRVVPRVSAIDVVAEPLHTLGVAEVDAADKAATLLQRLNVPERLWGLPPATFSGGEQQRVNIARGFVVDYPILLLDEPTASLDADNRAVVIDMIQEAKGRGVALVGIFHDKEVREAVETSIFDVERLEKAA